MGIGVCGTFCSSNSSSSEDMIIWRRRVAARFRRSGGNSGSKSDEISITSGFSRCTFRGSCTPVFFLPCLGRGSGDVVTVLICAPVFEILRSFATVLPWSSKTMISTSTTGEGGGFLASFFGGFATCLDSTLIELTVFLGANGRRTDAVPSTGFGVTFFFVVDFFLITGKVAFGLTGEGSGEVSDTGSSSAMTATGGEAVVLLLAPTLLRPSFATIL